MVKNLHAKQEMQVQSLSLEDPMEEEMAGYSPWGSQPTPVFLPGKWQRTEEPGRPQSMGSQKSQTQVSS